MHCYPANLCIHVYSGKKSGRGKPKSVDPDEAAPEDETDEERVAREARERAENEEAAIAVPSEVRGDQRLEP